MLVLQITPLGQAFVFLGLFIAFLVMAYLNVGPYKPKKFKFYKEGNIEPVSGINPIPNPKPKRRHRRRHRRNCTCRCRCEK